MTLRVKGGFKMTGGGPAGRPADRAIETKIRAWAAPASGQFAQETQAAKPAAAPARMALVKNACDIAGVCDTFDRCHHNVSHDPAETVHENGRIANESGYDLDNKGLHVDRLCII
jgi:hypothetical protein